MRLYKIFALLLVFISINTAVSAQDGDEINIDSTIVRLNVGTVSRSGKPIMDLTRGNFTIYEDGVKQEITRFEPTTSPFSLVMILDMSGSTIGFRQTIEQSAYRFVDSLAPDDRIAVIEFYDKVNLLNDFTSNRKIIAHSIGAANGRGKTQLYKAMSLALQKLASEGNRRKAIIVLTDGIDTDLRETDRNILAKSTESEVSTAIKSDTNPVLNNILTRAGVQGVTIYPLALPTGDPSKLADPSPNQIAWYKAARDRLQIMANRTGGTLNAINRLEEMGKFYAEVAADIRSLYTVEYESSNEKRDGKWREIKIEVNRPELITRTRPGYYAK